MNFDFLKAFPKLKTLYTYCSDAEDFALIKPNFSAMSARKAMEYIVKMIYIAVNGQDDGITTFEMITDPKFDQYVNDATLINTIHYIRKMGNVAVHGGELTKEEALKVLEQLHFLVGEFSILLGVVEDYPQYQKPEASTGTTSSASKEEPKANEETKKVFVEPEVVAQFATRMRQVKFNVKFKRDDEENRRMYMEACLREAGWPIVNVKNQALASAAGINMILDDGDSIDYVLYGQDNRPLAIIEYTETKNDLYKGRRKGIDKANKMSVKLGYKPIVYYTNGYQIYVIDQLGYEPRRVFQFHSIAELELLKLRATIRQDITKPTIDDTITNRKYQKEAITAACNAFAQNRRRSLLVMATGTGKTRVSISLVDILMKANWAKNVLFLADRTSLVRQAHKNFNKLLPSVTTSIYSGPNQDRDSSARIIFSTYQTMINLINDDTREFSIGRFDLIVVDEAHRSIFKKYGALFHYFDSLMIGLTATPRRDNENRSTYQVFGLNNGSPDYAYELEEAIKEGYLVGFSVVDKTTQAMRRGIYYDDLSDAEKEQLEDTFASGDNPIETTKWEGAHIELKNRVINLGTIDAMLNDLMRNGLKVEAGNKIGKTIIFASSHFEAEKIVERFQKIYSHLGFDFCKLIDSQIENAQGLIDSFGERDKMPQVVVSVDMMDTGIDVPDVLNLVFFKSVKSKIKFLQMIGRGTRLSPDIFGPSMDKQGFLIFDYYDNFNFFRTHNTWSTVDQKTNGTAFNIIPQYILINQHKLNILRALIEKDPLTPFEEAYKQELKQYFIDTTRNLCNDDIEVQRCMAYVNKYRTAEYWDGFTDRKQMEIEQHILPLFPSDQDPVKVKNFDLMMYVIEDEVPKREYAQKDIRKIKHGFGNVGRKIDAMIQELLKLKNIPEIAKKENEISRMQNADYVFEDFSLERCESVRKELRNLMQYIPDDVRYYVLNVEDLIIDKTDGESEFKAEKSYADKARDYMNSNNPIFAKIRNLDDLTQKEKDELEDVFKVKLGSAADYAAWSQNKPLLPYIRSQIGIADEAIQTKFGSFLNANVLNGVQLSYMNQIIDYARKNGDITFTDLMNVSPFSDVDVSAMFGTKIVHIKTLIGGLHNPVS